MNLKINTKIYNVKAIQMAIETCKAFAEFSCLPQKNEYFEINIFIHDKLWEKDFKKRFMNLLLEIHMNLA